MATNTKYGTGALGNSTTDTVITQNSAFGYCALQNNNSTYNNTAVGAFAGNANTGISNSILGSNALLKNVSGNYNTAFGTATLCYNMSSANTAIGSNAMANIDNDGYENTALGVSAGLNNKGNQNTYLGAETDAVGIYSNSTAIGYGSQIIDDNQIMMGTSLETVEVPGILNTTNDAYIHGLTVGLGGGSVSSNTAVGSSALAVNTSGSSNTAVGYNAGSTNSGNQNTYLGAGTDASSTFNNSTAIGYGAQIIDDYQIMMGTTEKVVIPGSAVLTNTDPASYSQATSIVPKSYVDSLASGVTPVASCQCATTVDVTLANEQIIDGYSAVAGNRVLVKSQGYYLTGNESTLNVANGIYVVVDSGAWTRAVDCSGNDVASTVTFIENGTVNGFTAFVEVAPSPAVAGTDALQYSVFYSTSFTLGNGLDLSGNTLNVDAELSGPSNQFLTFVGINGGTSTAYSLDTGTKDALVNGVQVGKGPGTGASNTVVGAAALQANTTGFFNTAVGAAALAANTSGNYNTAVGQNALNVNTIGTQNTVVGASALAANTTGNHNTAMGNSALQGNTTGYDNTGIGWNSLAFNTTGIQNTGLGVYALSSTTTATGNNNTGIGHSSLRYNTTGYENTAVGYQSLLQNTTGNQNTAIGGYTLRNNTTGINNTCMGWAAIDNSTTGSDNTVVGSAAMNLNSTGSSNTAIGRAVLGNNTTGGSNTAMGYQAMRLNITSYNNTAIGYQALYSITAASGGGNNTAIGYQALFYNTSTNNTALGWQAGVSITTGNNNTCLGYNAQPLTPTSTQSITLGDSSVTALRCNASLSGLSDARDKKDIVELNAGLDFVEKLKPVSFTWNMRDGGKVDIPDTGFIAQDLKQVQIDTGITIPYLVYDENPEKLEASYGKLLPVLVKAIQDLKKEVDELKAKLNA